MTVRNGILFAGALLLVLFVVAFMFGCFAQEEEGKPAPAGGGTTTISEDTSDEVLPTDPPNPEEPVLDQSPAEANGLLPDSGGPSGVLW